MLEVRENEIALGKLSSDTAHLHTLEGNTVRCLDCGEQVRKQHDMKPQIWNA